jgi:hypothetical protein
MQARDARRLFQDEPARLRLGGDDFADLTLAHQGRRARAGRGVGKKQLNVLGAHLAPVHPIGRARFPLDAPGHLDDLRVVEGGRRPAIGIVEDETDFGDIAGGPIARSGKNDVVHARRAHALVRALAHHPAQRFDEIGFAAAVRADNAGQARFDLEIGLVAEGFETGQTKLVESHGPGRLDLNRRQTAWRRITKRGSLFK